MISLLISAVRTCIDALENEQSLSLVVEDWISKISYGLCAIYERRGVFSRWLARVDAI